MKKKITLLISTVMAVVVFGLAACDENPLGGVPLTFEQVEGKVQEMPTSTDDGEIENAIDEVFGVDLNLPEGSYSAQTYTMDDVSMYVVTVSGANTTASDYYNSIKSEMIEKGYTAEDADLAFYKVSGAVVYSASVDADGSDVTIAFGATSFTQLPEGENPGGTVPGGTTPGGTIPGGTVPGGLPEGNLNAFPAATINGMFSELGVTIPNCTLGSSYSIDEQYTNVENGFVSITVTCYGMTAEDREAYKQALRDAGFQSQYYLVYSHSNRFYSDLVASSTYHDGNQTYTVTFSATYEEPAYTLPENVRIDYTTDGYYYYTAIKIGNDYYVKEEMSYDGTTMNFEEELYYRWTNEGWELWENYGDGWEQSTYGNETEIEYVEGDIFGFIVEEADIPDEAVRGEDATLLEKTVEVWDYESWGTTTKYYKDAETGILLKYEEGMYGYTAVYSVTSIDTTVTSFGDVELPQ
ncbi:MAG: hypothetical protein J6C93_04325 [Clostridia bacterium]|nr:hypothetical protein [Clostridia bacterium]